MPLKLYINGKPADLEPAPAIAQTRQVNDLNSIQDRQASYTNKFKLPKTAHNISIMNFLTVTGNTAAVPYEQNECSLYSDNGQCFIYKGRAVVTDGGEYYDVAVYDGIIDLYKSIENKNLTDLNLTELTHFKSVDSVIASWGNLPYRYILADYNGNIGNIGTHEVNIDYLVPSVNIKYLWDKIFNMCQATYSGAVFSTQNFTNLWMTYPKGVSNEDTDVLIFESSHFQYSATEENQSRYARFTEADTNLLENSPGNAHFRVAQAGMYKVSVRGNFIPVSGINKKEPYQMVLAWNAQDKLAVHAPSFSDLSDVLPGGTPFQKDVIIELAAHDTISIIIRKPPYVGSWRIPSGQGALIASITKLNQQVDFGQALADFSIRDFFTEVLHRFGLTMYKDKYDRLDASTGTYKPHYTFLTLQEQLQSADIVDWSDKFCRKLKEDYIYGSYARQNYMRYTYNDKESSYNDYHISVSNVNLQDSRDIIKSKIYSPESSKSDYFIRKSNVYKLWDKEISETEGEPVKYKPLDKRYYFLRSERLFPDPALILKSPALSESQTVTSCYVENFYKLRFEDIIRDYYGPVEQVLNRSVIVSAEMNLSEIDMCGFDFKKLYYIRQLSNYFMVNKINNYIPGKPVKCDLVRVQYSEEVQYAMPLRITKIIVSNQGISVFYDNTTGSISCTLVVENANTGSNYVSYTSANNPTYASPYPGYFRIYLQAGGYTSNEVYANFPANPSVTYYY